MKVYFTGEFRARRPVTVCTGIVTTLIGITLAITWVPQMFTSQWSADLVFPAIFATLFISAPLCLGVFLLTKVIKDERTQLYITSEGIKYGKRVFDWNDVEVLGVMRKYQGRRDLYCDLRSQSHQVELPLSKGLDSREIASLFEILNLEVKSSHPNINIVGETE